MSNAATLRTTGKPPLDLYAEYALPDGWLLFFAPEDLHVGSRCEAGGLCKPTTTSYLLTDAAAALQRFEARMAAGGVPLVGDGMAAKIHAKIRGCFASGWLFTDLTELEWMSPSTFVASTRGALERVDAAPRHVPSAGSMLMTYGWGTGLSAEEQR